MPENWLSRAEPASRLALLCPQHNAFKHKTHPYPPSRDVWSRRNKGCPAGTVFMAGSGNFTCGCMFGLIAFPKVGDVGAKSSEDFFAAAALFTFVPRRTWSLQAKKESP